MSDLLDSCRSEIDSLDDALLQLLKQRAEVVARLCVLKQVNDAPLRDHVREAEIIARISHVNDSLLNQDDLITIYRTIFAACLNLQKSLS